MKCSNRILCCICIYCFNFFLLNSIGFAQNKNNIWLFGEGNFLDFNSNLQDPILTHKQPPVSIGPQREAVSTICDASGNLLFMCNDKCSKASLQS